MLTTESASHYDHLDEMSVRELLENMNREDQSVPLAVAGAIPQLETLVTAVVERMRQGGRLFYIGAGTSGRLGVLDASECPPTYGVAFDVVIGLIAGGDGAIRRAVEKAEDNPTQAWADMAAYAPGPLDSLVGLAASGTTPYVIGGVQAARRHGLLTGCITCNAGTPLAAAVACPVEAIVGPEFVTGSTRMKAGTAQKLLLNMLSTSVMIQLGHVKGNRMVDMKLSNDKLVSRGIRMVAEELGLAPAEAAALLERHGSVRAAVASHSR